MQMVDEPQRCGLSVGPSKTPVDDVPFGDVTQRFRGTLQRQILLDNDKRSNPTHRGQRSHQVSQRAWWNCKSTVSYTVHHNLLTPPPHHLPLYLILSLVLISRLNYFVSPHLLQLVPLTHLNEVVPSVFGIIKPM